ncbi:uncharacterized protein GGS22DRAFT_191294 [Annulohypoxylon maeteangense]|uniref:uncharacterized protein n=1 Tax=Annulohypoxylon maeteangense TaxID=1927788 RepID=UPI00200894F9|nr:uncharacterized protein GGS22DRAFT_191294 [Annulohypoxylon maeteangense]KAI0882124.1 hypothetical protein GGS22DRAFT_191294 [Annulohypoxylon maeteangense]
MTTTASLHAKLDALYAVWQTLTLDSPAAEISKFADFFDENCTAYLLSMRELATPMIGRAGVIEGIKTVLQDTQIKERRVVDRLGSTGGSKISVEMSNRLVVHGKEIAAFPETATAVFNDRGLITDFKIYCCRSPIVEIVQDVTGVGPYRREEKCH